MYQARLASVSAKAGLYIRGFLPQAVCNAPLAGIDGVGRVIGFQSGRQYLLSGRGYFLLREDEARLRDGVNEGLKCQPLLRECGGGCSALLR